MSSEVSARGTLIAFVVVAVLIIGGGALVLSARPQPVQIVINPPLPTATPEPTHTPEPITVYVTGAVNQPETMVSLPYGSRVEDALNAAGGAADNANLTLVNLAAVLRDGDQIHVPDSSTTAQAESGALPTPSGGELVFINSATIEEIQNLPGIGPALAGRIIEYREANGAFTSLEDLDAVSGIGPALLERIAPLVSFE